MNKAEIKKQESISIGRFLKSYVGVTNEGVIDILAGLSHRELKEVCREVYGIKLCSLPFDVIDEDFLQDNEVLFVTDKGRHVAPYLNPARREYFDDIVAEQEIFTGPFYDSTVTRDEYIDSIENIAGDANVSSRRIKLVGTSSRISREE